MNETPEEQLLKQARNARIGKGLDKKPLTLDSSGIVVGYNADYHLNEVQMWDGSLRYAEGLTNGARATGEGILYSSEGHVESPNHVKRPALLSRPALKVVLHNLKALAVVESVSGIQFFVGSERVKVKAISFNLSPDDPDFKRFELSDIRLDNLNAKKLSGWAITSLWDDVTQRSVDTSGIALSLDATNQYAERVFLTSAIKIAGAYFFTPTLRLLAPHVDSIVLDGEIFTESRREPPRLADNIYSPFDQFDTYNILSNQTVIEGSARGGNLVFSPSPYYQPNNSLLAQEVPRSGRPNQNCYLVPATATATAALNNNIYTIEGFSALGELHFNLSSNHHHQAKFARFNVFPSFYTHSLDINVNKTLNRNTQQTFQTIYRSNVTHHALTTRRTIKTSLNFSKPMADDSNANPTDPEMFGPDGTIGQYQETRAEQYTCSGLTVNLLPFGATESTFDETLSQEVNSSGWVPYYSCYQAPNAIKFNESSGFPNGDYIGFLVDVNSISDLLFNIETRGRPVQHQTSFNADSIRTGRTHVTLVTSTNGKSALIKASSQLTNEIDEGIYHYKLTDNLDSGSFVEKTQIEYSDPNLAYSYDLPDLYLGDMTVGQSLFIEGEFPLPLTIPETKIEYEYKDGAKCFHGTGSILSANQEGINLRMETKQQVSPTYGNNIFAQGLTIYTLGYRVISQLNRDDSTNVTLKDGTIFLSNCKTNDLFNSKSYWVWVDTYKLKPSPRQSNQFYLERQPFKFIKCPPINMTSEQTLKNVVFAYST